MESISTSSVNSLRASLKEKFSQDSFTDTYLEKWLWANDGNLQSAESGIIDNIIWRTVENMDGILNEKFEPILSEYVPGGILGRDKSGYPCFIFPVGKLDALGLVNSICTHQFIRYQMSLIEAVYCKTFVEVSKEAGRTINKMTLIFDLESVTVKHIGRTFLDMITETMKVAERNYPDTIKKAFVVNSPFFFWGAFKLIKPFLRKSTLDKISFIDSVKTLKEYFDDDQLLEKYGGTLKDNNNVIKWGGKIPIEKYPLKTIDDPKSIDIPQSQFKIIECEIEAPSILFYQFFTVKNDMIYSISRRISSTTSDTTSDNNNNNSELILKPMKVNCHIVKEWGKIHCDIPGKYFLKFDNSYSIMTMKTVFYKIEIENKP